MVKLLSLRTAIARLHTVCFAFASVDFDAAPEGDGIANGLKYFLGSNRSMAKAAIMARGTGPSGFRFRHARNEAAAPDVDAVYQWSADLLTWHGDGESADGTTVAFGAAVSDDTHPNFDVSDRTATVTGVMPRRMFVRPDATHSAD